MMHTFGTQQQIIILFILGNCFLEVNLVFTSFTKLDGHFTTALKLFVLTVNQM